jgi:16S rRNA G1207 methylase RsmC
MKSFRVASVDINFETKPDLFSPKGLDMGTELLLSTLPKFEYESALDWGCGWGAIALWLAKNNSNAKITAVDSDIAAVKTAQENATLNSIYNVQIMASHGFDEIPESHKFDLICSNPPTHRGREVVDSMIIKSHEHIKDGGYLLLVVESRIKPWVSRQMKEVFGDAKILKRGPKNVVVMAQK